jgi:hypothetical protein
MTADAKTVMTLDACAAWCRVSNAEDAALIDTPRIDENSPDVLINKGL